MIYPGGVEIKNSVPPFVFSMKTPWVRTIPLPAQGALLEILFLRERKRIKKCSLSFELALVLGMGVTNSASTTEPVPSFGADTWTQSRLAMV